MHPGFSPLLQHPTNTQRARPAVEPAGKLVTLRGTVVRMSLARPLVTQMDFMCGKCGAKATCAFEDGQFTPPTRCAGSGGG